MEVETQAEDAGSSEEAELLVFLGFASFLVSLVVAGAAWLVIFRFWLWTMTVVAIVSLLSVSVGRRFGAAKGLAAWLGAAIAVVLLLVALTFAGHMLGNTAGD